MPGGRPIPPGSSKGVPDDIANVISDQPRRAAESEIQNGATPHVLSKANQLFGVVNSQFSTPVIQSANNVWCFAIRCVDFTRSSKTSHPSNLDSLSHLHEQNVEFQRTQQTQSQRADVVGKDRQKLNEVASATDRQAHVVRLLRGDVQLGFLRTSDVLRRHDDRIRSGPKLPVVKSEAPQDPWRSSSNSSMAQESHFRWIRHMSPLQRKFPINLIVFSHRLFCRRVKDDSAPMAFEEKQMDILDPRRLTIGMILRPRTPTLKCPCAGV